MQETKPHRRLFLAAGLSVLVSVVVGSAYLRLDADHTSRSVSMLAEAFKVSLALVFLTVGGSMIKAPVEEVVDRQRIKRARAEERERLRRSIREEFVAIYSEFYSLRKLYHSARSRHNDLYDRESEAFRDLLRWLLKEAVGLEGRYGALKILAISHFGLPTGDYGTKEVGALKEEIERASDEEEKARLRLDLLGEYYDDWRHALESKEHRKIQPEEDFFDVYDRLLAFYESTANKELMEVAYR